MNKNNSLSNFFKKIIIIAPILVSIIFFVIVMKNKKGPERLEYREVQKVVSVIKPLTVDVIPKAIGYGYVQPGRSWQAVAQASGKIVEISPLLKVGNFINTEKFLIKIDPTPYELSVAQIEASISNIHAQINELDAKEKNLKSSFEIEEKALKIAKSELTRQERLYKKATTSASKFELQKLNYYQQLSKLQNIKNSLNLIPANKKALKANLALNKVKLEDAKYNLTNTIIKAPFECRITSVKVEIAQFVQKGQLIATADGLKTAEIAVQIPVSKARTLFTSINKDTEHYFKNMLHVNFEKFLGLVAKVNLFVGDEKIVWDAKIDRVDASFDPKTRTAGFIAVVDDPYKKSKLGVRPPLYRNMFCEVEIIGKLIKDQTIIPRSALHNENTIYLIDSDSRLKIINASIAFTQSNFIVIKNDIDKNNFIVTSDLIPAIEGMLLKPKIDENLKQSITLEACGKSN